MTDLLSVADAAAALNYSPKQLYRMIERGHFRDFTGKFSDNSIGIARWAVEKLIGRPIEPKPRRGRGRPATNSEAIEPSPLRQPLTGADFFLIARGAAEQRDRQWQERLFSKNISIDAPPITAEPFRAYFDMQHLFTVTQVRELLARAVRERDLAWRIWADDPLERMQSPKGPGPFDWAELEHPEKRS
jgi:hypothetical protein